MTRLIDADKIPWTDLSDGRGLCYVTFLEKVQRLPTVKEINVRHGKWIEDGSFKYKHGGRNSDVKELFGTEWRTMRRIKCSLCNKITLVDETILYEYCPHCGAKMDGEQHDHTD